MIATIVVASVVWLAQALPQAGAEEDAVRAAVQQYYEAQGHRDVEATLAFWSTSANPRPTREAFLAVFGDPAEDSFVVDVRRVEIEGPTARVRVVATRSRVMMRDGVPFTQRASFLNAQLWRKDAAGWKLLRDGPFAEEVADDLIAAAGEERPALFDKHRNDLVAARLAISQRATMAITLAKDYPRGRKLFELALDVSRATRDRIGEANSLHNIAQVDYFLGAFASAADLYDKELAIGRESADESIAAAALFGLATVAYSRADYTTAIGRYREALAIYEKNEDGSSIGRALVSIGNVQYLQAEYDAAAASYRRAVTLLIAGQDLLMVSFAQSGLGRVFAAQGDIAAALDVYGGVLAQARKNLVGDPRLKDGVAAPLESIGELYYRLGNSDQARASFEEARTLTEGNPVSDARLSGDIGLVELVAGHFDAALAAYTRSRLKCEQASDPAGVAHAWVGIGFSHAAREKWTDAMTAYRTAIRMFVEQKQVEDAARAWLGLSMAQSGSGDHLAALESARRVAADAEKVRSTDLGWRAATRAGEALRGLSRLDEARGEFQRAIAAIETLAADAPVNPELRSQLDDSATAWTGLAFVSAAQGNAREALNAIEARRAHIRRMQLAPFQRNVTRGMSPEEQADEQAIVRELMSTRSQLNAERRLPHPDPARLEKLQQQFQAVSAKRAEQQSRLYARLPELQRWRGVQAATVDDLARIVPTSLDLAIEYLLGDDELLAVTIVRGEDGPDVAARITPLKRREFGEQVALALQPSALKDETEWRTRAAPLATAVLEPIASHLAGHSRVLIVPDDVLWRVPFEALRVGEGPIGARSEISYATSLATLAVQQEVAAARTPRDTVTAALFAAPEIPPAIRTQLTLAQAGWKEPEEAQAIASSAAAAKSYGDAAIVKTKSDASEAAIRAAFAAADVLHVAGPVQASGTAPLLSMMVLSANGNELESDGRWELRDWFNASSQARVLVLADGASFGTPGAGSAMDAFAWAAAAAGVPSLVVARWPAGGFAMDEIVPALHTALAKGQPVAEAVRAAMMAARARKGDAPAVWTGLRLIGPGR